MVKSLLILNILNVAVAKDKMPCLTAFKDTCSGSSSGTSNVNEFIYINPDGDEEIWSCTSLSHRDNEKAMTIDPENNGENTFGLRQGLNFIYTGKIKNKKAK